MYNIKKFAGLFLFITCAFTTPLWGKSLFDPAITINNQVISQYALDQRIAYYRFVGETGDLKKLASDVLIDEALKRSAAKTAGLTVPDALVQSSMKDFASRGGLSLDEFTAALENEGGEQQTFRDFIEINLTWRDVINATFAEQGEISETEIDQIISRANSGTTLEVLLSEIVLPARPVSNEQELAILNSKRIKEITSFDEFSLEARRLSAVQSAQNGGRLDWVSISEIPERLRPIIQSMRPGEVTEPININNALLMFQMHDIRETGLSAAEILETKYSLITVAEGDLAKTQAALVSCADFYGFAKNTENSSFKNQSLPKGKIPTYIALALANLDTNEMAIIPSGTEGTKTIVMLCGHTTEVNENLSRDQIINDLRQRRFSSMADGYLQDLRSTAQITYH